MNISSTASRVPRGGNPAYGVAKAAQDRLTQDLAFEFAPKGVRVNSVLPGGNLAWHAAMHRTLSQGQQISSCFGGQFTSCAMLLSAGRNSAAQAYVTLALRLLHVCGQFEIPKGRWLGLRAVGMQHITPQYGMIADELQRTIFTCIVLVCSCGQDRDV